MDVPIFESEIIVINSINYLNKASYTLLVTTLLT